MSLDQQTDSGKDKRLLVLLALGVLILFSCFPALLPDRQAATQSWGWVEDAGEGISLQRILLSEGSRRDGNISGGSLEHGQYPLALTALLQRHRAVAVRGEGAVSTRITPRLALLLGLPFPVNRATIDELTLLQDIGPKLAASIVNYRERRGTIADAREFRAVPGIGERLTARIAPQLSFE